MESGWKLLSRSWDQLSSGDVSGAAKTWFGGVGSMLLDKAAAPITLAKGQAEAVIAVASGERPATDLIPGMASFENKERARAEGTTSGQVFGALYQMQGTADIAAPLILGPKIVPLRSTGLYSPAPGPRFSPLQSARSIQRDLRNSKVCWAEPLPPGPFGQKLRLQLASQEQLGELFGGKGKPIMGAGTSRSLDHAGRLAQQYGGEPGDWAKVTSSNKAHPHGYKQETHAYMNAETKRVVEPKTKLIGH